MSRGPLHVPQTRPAHGRRALLIAEDPHFQRRPIESKRALLKRLNPIKAAHLPKILDLHDAGAEWLADTGWGELSDEDAGDDGSGADGREGAEGGKGGWQAEGAGQRADGRRVRRRDPMSLLSRMLQVGFSLSGLVSRVEGRGSRVEGRGCRICD